MKYFIVTALIFSLAGCTKSIEKRKNPVIKPSGLSAYSLEVDTAGLSKLTATIKTVHGNIKIQFYPKKAPNTVNRMIKLIQDGFYDGLTFHKVVPNFAIQTGDPTDTGMGGSGTMLKAEFNDTKTGKTEASVAFRFSQRLGDDSTAHETGIFLYTSTNAEGKLKKEYIHFEALLLRRGEWKIVMEYQKSKATASEWNALEPKNLLILESEKANNEVGR